jgi:hypothetical protein
LCTHPPLVAGVSFEPAPAVSRTPPVAELVPGIVVETVAELVLELVPLAVALGSSSTSAPPNRKIQLLFEGSVLLNMIFALCSP